MRWKASFALPLLLLIASCASHPPLESLAHPLAPYSEAKAPLFEGMGNHTRDVTTSNPEAQRYFNQGYALALGFNHDEAVRSFAEAAKLDENCAMAYWGMAYALGPNFNLPMEGEAGQRAYQAIQEAVARKEHASEVERDLIDALAQRYSYPPASNQARLDLAYANAMRALWQKYPEDTDIGYLLAEALLVLNPWDQWTKTGEPKHHTLEVVATLERLLELDANHPGANHLYIHAMEGSQTPEKAEAAADRLGALIPGIGHIVHMPAHIYMRVGRYKDSLRVNAEATALDTAYFKQVGPMGIYHVYQVHNDHFLAWGSMMIGRDRDAIRYADQMVENLPEWAQGIPDLAPFMSMKLEVYIRFGRWQDILQSPRPREDQPYCVAMWHYARGIAYANTGNILLARDEAKHFNTWAGGVSSSQTILGIGSARDVLKVAREMLAGETEYKAGDVERGFRHLRAAVEAENALPYTEPSPWIVPTRHALAALLLEQGRVEEAESIYRYDLTWYPENGWSLHGLAECLEKRGEYAEAADVRERFKKAWADATVVIPGSCFCRTRN
jgi:tetratricopeptide (TPR) repeat protein